MIELLNLMWALRENQEQLISGPGISAMVRAFHDMQSRGNPAEERNDYGFNHGDWQSYGQIVSRVNLSNGVALPIVNRIMDILSHYKNSQLKGTYDEIYKAVVSDIKQSHGHVEVGEKAIVFSNEQSYGKVRVYVPGGINRSQIIRFNKILNKYIESKNITPERDQYGKVGFSHVAFKFFSKDKNENLHSYYVDPNLIPGLTKILQEDKIPVEVKGNLPTPSASSVQRDVPGNNKPHLKIVDPKLRATDWGRKLFVTFELGYSASQELRDKLTQIGLWRKAIGYLKKENGVGIYGIDPAYFDDPKFLSILEEYLDISLLKKFIAENGRDIKDEFEKARLAGTDAMSYVDLPKGALKIKVNYRTLDTYDKAILKEMITFIFSDAKWNNPDYSWNVSGDYNQYVKFGRLLKNHGYNVDQFREVFKAKLGRGDLAKDDVDGELPEGFVNHVQDMLPNSQYEYYKEQKEGVGFLYSNRAAVLGDSTGLGKTIQLIGAAELKMMAHDYNFGTLFFTINDQLVQQAAKEIVGVVGESAIHEISTDIMNPKRWTIVKYSTFSGSGPDSDQAAIKIQAVIKKIQSTNYGVVIFDELHKLKHQNSARSKNVEEATKNIKIRWGASATISANKPMDVRNQLRLLDHHLGKMDEKRFKANFAGRTKGLIGEEKENAKIAAAENLNKWLNLSGVYIRRNKDEVKEMPNLDVNSAAANIDVDGYQRRVAARIKKLKDPELPISILGAHRLELAVAKVPDTVKTTMDLVKKGERVVVFTGFIDAARELHVAFKDQLLSLGGKLLTYTSDTSAKDRKKVKKLFTEDQSYKVLLMSLKMGGTGIDFPNAARHMVINDYDWTPESAEQSEGRIYRINTTHPVQIHYIIARNTLDADLYAMVQQKRKIAAIIQQYRREYHSERNQQKANDDLKKLIDAQKELDNLDKKMTQMVLHSEGFVIRGNLSELRFNIFDNVIED